MLGYARAQATRILLLAISTSFLTDCVWLLLQLQGAVAPEYPFEMPTALKAVGYTTASIGKDHFGWNASRTLPPLLPKFDTGDKGSGTPHGYEGMTLYDGLVGQEDEYHEWFKREMPGHEAEEGWPTLNVSTQAICCCL